MARGLEDRTDNTYLPNTPEGWVAFRWRMHFAGAHAVILWAHYVNTERDYRRNKQRELEEGKDV